MSCCTVVSVESDINDLFTQFKNLTLLLQIKIKNIENILEQVMTVSDSQFTASSYQQYLSWSASQNYSLQDYSSANYAWAVVQTSSSLNAQFTWNQMQQQNCDCNVCWFCNEWDHHCWICSHLLHLIETEKIHLNKKLYIIWNSQKSEETFMLLDSSMCQLDFIQMLLKEKEWWNETNSEHHHDTNLLNLQCDLNSNIEKNDLLKTFKYQIFSMKNLKILAVSQNSQKKHDCECSLYTILN